jgi:hypothetical protein
MTDIVERLRDSGVTNNRLMFEAAHDIERLRAALQDIAIGVGESVLSQDAMRARAYDALQVI